MFHIVDVILSAQQRRSLGEKSNHVLNRTADGRQRALRA